MVRFLLALVLAPTVLFAGSYDGLYRPDGDWAKEWDCRSVGSDGGALAVQDNEFFGVENMCRLTNPVSVRDMDATLYDAECAGEGELYSERIMLMTISGGIAVVRDGSAINLLRCE